MRGAGACSTRGRQVVEEALRSLMMTVNHNNTISAGYAAGCAGSMAPVDVGTVVNGHDGHDVGNPVNDAEVAAAGAV